jgi:hypothetical protein
MSRLFLFCLAPTPDPRRGLALDIARIVKPDCHQVALKEPAQVIAAAIEAELHATPVDRGFHLGRAGERKGYVGSPGWLLSGHFQTWLINVAKATEPTIQKIIWNLASLISPRIFSISVRNSPLSLSISARRFANWISNHKRSRASKASTMASAWGSGKPADFSLFNTSITVIAL